VENFSGLFLENTRYIWKYFVLYIRTDPSYPPADALG